jgi:hypothetical protein
MKETVIIAGSIAQKPGRAGHAWAFLQYVLGFKKLGWNVVLVDHLDPSMCVDSEGKQCPVEKSTNVGYFVRLMKEFDLDDSYALLHGNRDGIIGMSRSKLLEKARHAALLINVMGYLRDTDILERVRKRVFLDIDPGFGQMWQELGLCTMFTGHDAYVTVGENIGRDGCTIPTCGLNWIPSRPPVQLDHWTTNGTVAHGGFTTIASWRGDYNAIEFRGKTYGLRVHEFRKVAPLPKSTNGRFEIALDIHPADAADKSLLQENGWRLLEPQTVSSDPWTYRRFIRNSAAEFMVAKNMYVETRSGWFSDRSCCYLASGKPVLALDTGLKSLYPVGRGLLTFTSLDEAVSGVQEISRNYQLHARAARDVAVEYFDSDKVLRSLVENCL